jgi:hypothetical protein
MRGRARGRRRLTTGEYAGGTGTFTSTQTGGDNVPMTDVYKVTLP